MQITNFTRFKIVSKLTTAILFMLKVNDVIGLSWWYVLLPLYGGFIITFLIEIYKRKEEFKQIYRERDDSLY
jgi:hypothetical protein